VNGRLAVRLGGDHCCRVLRDQYREALLLPRILQQGQLPQQVLE
jgi:hypothetical protein